MNTHCNSAVFASVLLAAGLWFPLTAKAHCDTMDGPVVQAAKLALDRQSITPVLKWVRQEAEPELKAAFQKTLLVRAQSAEARELADRFFFETLVRLHRAGEGAPFTGLKPAGSDLEPAVLAVDKSLDRGSSEQVVKLVATEAAAGIRRRFAAVQQAKAHAEHSIDAGRAYVAAYVEYVHYVEALHRAAQGTASHHEVAKEFTPSAGTGRSQPAQHQHGDAH